MFSSRSRPPASVNSFGFEIIGLLLVPRQVTEPFMKQILAFLCLAVVFFQSGCAVGPPIEQQTLEQQKQAQAEKRSDAFARGLPQ
jgi:hypothetical protein